MEHIGSAMGIAARLKGQFDYSPDYFRERLPLLRSFDVNDQTIKRGAILLLDLIKQERICGNCQGYDKCGKEGDSKGLYDYLDLYQDQLTVRTGPCNPFLKHIEMREASSLREFSEKTFTDKEYRFENFPQEQARKHPELYAAAMEFASGYDHRRNPLEQAAAFKGLYIFGSPGVGKTHLMLAICNMLDDRQVPNIFVRADTIFDKLRGMAASGQDMEAVLEKYCTVPVLAIDEFAQERANEFTLDKMFRIINHRFSNRLPTLFTSNYEPPAVYKTFYDSTKTVDAMISRIVQMTRIGRLTGKDARLSQVEFLDA